MPENELQVPGDTTDLKEKITSLYAYIANRLGLQEVPSITISKSKANADKAPFDLTAYYDHDKKNVKLYITDRHETDILRSFAHEIIHHWQNLRGTLHPKSETHNNDHDTKPSYAQNDMWLRKREMEAYLFGCILFRDWQDEHRHGTPKSVPFLPQPYD